MTHRPSRRRLLGSFGTATALGLAGCGSQTDVDDEDGGDGTSNGTVVTRGSTTFDGQWSVTLRPDVDYELQLTQREGIFATVAVQRRSDASIVAHLDTENEETITTPFAVPAEDTYLVILQVNGADSPRGRASFVIRAV